MYTKKPNVLCPYMVKCFLIVQMVFCLAETSYATCNVKIEAKHLPFGSLHYKDSEFIALESTASGLRELNTYVSKRKKKGKLDFSKKHKKLLKYDEVIFEKSSLAGIKQTMSAIKNHLEKNCVNQNPKIAEIKDSEQIYYLVNCKSKKKTSSPVKVDFKKKYVSSPSYHYKYNPENNLLFDEIKLFGSKKPLIKNSELLIHSDFKYFWTMNFDSTDIKSNLNNHRSSPFGLEADVSFFLKILFFKIKLALMTDAFFYPDLVNVPMVMHIPKSASDYVEPGSSILYYWDLLKDSLTPKINMPLASAKGRYIDISKKKKELENISKKYCKGHKCKFNISYISKDFKSILDFDIPMHLVKKGFYPQYFTKNPLTTNDGEKITSLKKVEKGYLREGVLFNYAYLSKGDHRWNFNIEFSKSAKTKCKNIELRSKNIRLIN